MNGPLVSGIGTAGVGKVMPDAGRMPDKAEAGTTPEERRSGNGPEDGKAPESCEINGAGNAPVGMRPEDRSD